LATPREITICHKTVNRNIKAVVNMDYDNDVNAAVFLSWNKKKKKYEDEIARLKEELAECRKNLDKVQKSVISGYISKRGRNNSNKKGYDRYQHMNGEILSHFCKNKMFPHYKFLQPSYMIYSPENTRSLCYKINELIDKPPHIQSEIDDEFYWVNCTVPMISKKYCEIRSNFTTDIKKIYMGE
jgi:hypothetical protein